MYSVLVQRELDKSTSMLRDCLACRRAVHLTQQAGREGFSGITKLRIVLAARKMEWQ